jgi:cytochrome c-type biogenesis protein CcmH
VVSFRANSFSSPLVFSIVILLVLFYAGDAQAPTPNPPTDDEVNRIARQIYCPVCENTPLDICPTQACAEWRELIREKLAEGWSDKQIMQYFVDRFGDHVLAMPPLRGINWLVYFVPLAAFFAGAYLLYRAFPPQGFTWKRASRQINPEQDSEATNTNDEYTQKLEEELRKD